MNSKRTRGARKELQKNSRSSTKTQKFPAPDRRTQLRTAGPEQNRPGPGGPGRRGAKSPRAREKTHRRRRAGRAPLTPTMAIVPSGAGEIALAQLGGARIVGTSGTSDSWTSVQGERRRGVRIVSRSEAPRGRSHGRVAPHREGSDRPGAVGAARRVSLRRVQESRGHEGRGQPSQHPDRAGLSQDLRCSSHKRCTLDNPSSSA
jgi:hypothetical protein